MIIEKNIRDRYQKITQTLVNKDISITTMESCTSGQIASLLTDTEGASQILKGAFVTYSNEAKVMNGVPKETIDTYGVYSKETAMDMASACMKTYNADMGIGITGSLGRVDPNNKDSVSGEVYFAIYSDTEKTKLEEDVRLITLAEASSRYELKMMVADAIAEALERMLDIV